MRRCFHLLLCATALMVVWPGIPGAQERTVDEIKREISRRAATRTPPFDHVKVPEVELVLQSMQTIDPADWGPRWCNVGLEHEKRGDELLKRGAAPKVKAGVNPDLLATLIVDWLKLQLGGSR